ncbi:MAG: hypothetical protein U5R31_06205 [Acidimicrobiia bacterium]|nr:hypothetical protein [Acidimicrobiia bacterium]
MADKRRRRDRAAVVSARPAPDHEHAARADVTALDPDALGIKSDRGRDVLGAWQRGELTAVELRRRWLALGELDAIERVRRTGRLGPEPDSGEGLTAAQLALDAAERELAAAENELSRHRDTGTSDERGETERPSDR